MVYAFFFDYQSILCSNPIPCILYNNLYFNNYNLLIIYSDFNKKNIHTYRIKIKCFFNNNKIIINMLFYNYIT